jgi:hypothetical protein
MGFPRDACLEALKTSNGDENRALNILLGQDSGPAAAAASSTASAAEVPAKPAKPSAGLFGKVWGKSTTK